MPTDAPPTWDETEAVPTWDETEAFGSEKMEEGRAEAEKQAAKAKLYTDLITATKNLNPLRGIPNAITAVQRATGLVPPDQPDMIPENASLINFHEQGTPPAPWGLNVGVEWEPNQNKIGQALQGLGGAAMKVAGGLTDVDMVPMLAAGAAGRVLPAAIAGSMVPTIPDLGKEAGRVAAEHERRLAAGEEPSIRPVVEALADAGIQAGFVAGAPVRGALEGRRAGLSTPEQLRAGIPTGPPSLADQIKARRAQQSFQEVNPMFGQDVIRPPWESVSTADTSRAAEIPGVETPFDAAVARAKVVLPQAAAALEGKSSAKPAEAPSVAPVVPKRKPPSQFQIAQFNVWLSEQTDAAKLRQLRSDHESEGNTWAAEAIDNRLEDLGKLTLQGGKNAVQEQGASPLPVGNASKVGQEVGGQVPGEVRGPAEVRAEEGQVAPVAPVSSEPVPSSVPWVSEPQRGKVYRQFRILENRFKDGTPNERYALDLISDNELGTKRADFSRATQEGVTEEGAREAYDRLMKEGGLAWSPEITSPKPYQASGLSAEPVPAPVEAAKPITPAAEPQPAPGSEVNTQGAGAAAVTAVTPEPAKEVIPHAEEKGKGQVPLTEPGAPAAPEAGTGEGGTPIIGMGNAVPSEFEAQGRVTANKDAVIDAERVQRGAEPLIQPLRRSNQEVYDKAVAELNKNPELPDLLVKELQNTARPLKDWEHMLLLRRRVELNYELDKAGNESAQAYDDMVAARQKGLHDAAEARNDALIDAKARRADWEDKLDALDRAVGHGGAGTEAGRALAIRRAIMAEDFSLAKLEHKMRENRGWEPITDAERSELAKLSAEVKAKDLAYTEAQKLSDAKTQQMALDHAIEVARLEAAAKPKYAPRVIQIAESFANFMDKKAVAAEARLREKFSHMTAGVDPTMLADLAIVGAARITRGMEKSARWVDEMRKITGDWINDKIDMVWTASQKEFDRQMAQIEKTQGKITADKVKEVVTKTGTDDITEKIRAKLEKDGKEKIHPFVRQLVKGIVTRNPKIDREALIDEVHGVLSEIIPGFTRLEAMDAISGRGLFSLPNPEEIAARIRDLSTQIRLVGHQIDVEAGHPLPRTGPQRDKMSDAARQEQQKLNELKRKYGVVETDPVAQLASVLTARKTYYQHRLSDLQQEIATRERIVKTKTPSPTDAKLEALKAEYEKVKAEHHAIFGDRTLTDAQRVQIALKAAERTEKEWIDRLEKAKRGVFEPGSKPSTTPQSDAVDAIRARTKAIQEEVKELKDLANPKKTPQERALQTIKTRLANETAMWKEKIATGDYTLKEKTVTKWDNDALKAKVELNKVKRAAMDHILAEKMSRKSRLVKVLYGMRNTWDLTRVILTSYDLSALLRQGKLSLATHPIITLKAVPAMLKAFSKPDFAEAVYEDIVANRSNSPLYARSKLYISDIFGRLSESEENYMAEQAWIHKVPGVGGSQRAYTTFLNKVRADTFDYLVEKLGRNGEVTEVEAKAIANMINVFTGRGKFLHDNQGGKTGEVVNQVLFSPRFLVSRFQVLAGQPLYGGTMRTRGLVAGEYAKILGAYATVYALASAAGYGPETDPRSSDFGKIVIGNTRIDPMAGLSQATVFLTRNITGKTKNVKGEVKPIRGQNVKFGQTDVKDIWMNFGRSKLSPNVGLIFDFSTGKDFMGNPITGSSLAQRMVPISLMDIYQSMQAQGIPAGTALGVLSIFGESIQTYQNKTNGQPIKYQFQ
jgi:hypothetical protein